MRSCRSSHKVRKAVVDSHKPLRPSPPPPPPPPPHDHASETTTTTTKAVHVFGGLPHRLPKPQQFTAGQLLPMPLPPDPPQPGNNNEDDQSTPNRSTRNPPPPPPPPPPFSSPSSSGQCSPLSQLPEPCKSIFDQEHPGSPAAHIDPPPACTSSSSSSSTSSESTNNGSASPPTWYCNPNSAIKPIATTPAAPAMNVGVVDDDGNAVLQGSRVRSTSCGILSPPLGFRFIAPIKYSSSAVPEPAISESSSSASTAGIADIRCGDDDVQVFRSEEIERAWRSKFSPDRRAADQTMGDDVSVFRAWMIDRGGLNKSMVMIVREQCRSLQVSRDWHSKLNLISHLDDRHLSKLRGYCVGEEKSIEKSIEGSESHMMRRDHMLVYEHTCHGSLRDYLLGSLCKALLHWKTRIKIALGAARGLAYIHDIAPVEVVYKDFKSSNILLGNEFHVKLAGCGLHVITRDKNKLARASSKVFTKSQASAKRNIQSFGFTMLELLTGKCSKDDEFCKDEKQIIQWAKPYLRDHDKLMSVIDPQMRRQYSSKGAKKLGDLTLQCLRKDPKRRPNISEVIEVLQTIISLPPVDKKSTLHLSDLSRCRSLKRVYNLPMTLSRTTSNKV